MVAWEGGCAGWAASTGSCGKAPVASSAMKAACLGRGRLLPTPITVATHNPQQTVKATHCGPRALCVQQRRIHGPRTSTLPITHLNVPQSENDHMVLHPPLRAPQREGAAEAVGPARVVEQVRQVAAAGGVHVEVLCQVCGGWGKNGSAVYMCTCVRLRM